MNLKDAWRVLTGTVDLQAALARVMELEAAEMRRQAEAARAEARQLLKVKTKGPVPVFDENWTLVDVMPAGIIEKQRRCDRWQVGSYGQSTLVARRSGQNKIQLCPRLPHLES